jgi:hypothetical protein
VILQYHIDMVDGNNTPTQRENRRKYYSLSLPLSPSLGSQEEGLIDKVIIRE